jgi:gamma-glutamylcyclotransferase (GGCT)/AIG2-like uncharacterized protein YtfP
METEKLFVYGILVGTRDDAKYAILPGFKKIVRGHDTIINSNIEDYVEGEFFDVTKAQLNHYDWIEGFPEYYIRKKVKIYTTGGLEKLAWVYQQKIDSANDELFILYNTHL